MRIRRHFENREESEIVGNFGEAEVRVEQDKREGTSRCKSQIGVRKEKEGLKKPKDHKR